MEVSREYEVIDYTGVELKIGKELIEDFILNTNDALSILDVLNRIIKYDHCAKCGHIKLEEFPFKTTV